MHGCRLRLFDSTSRVSYTQLGETSRFTVPRVQFSSPRAGDQFGTGSCSCATTFKVPVFWAIAGDTVRVQWLPPANFDKSFYSLSLYKYRPWITDAFIGGTVTHSCNWSPGILVVQARCR